MKGQEEARPSRLSLLAIPFIYFVHVCLGSGGVSSLCCWRAASAARNPSPRRRGRPGARPIPGWTSVGRGRGQDGKRAERASCGAAGRPCVPRRRGARPGPRPSSARCRWNPPSSPSALATGTRCPQLARCPRAAWRRLAHG